MQNKFCPTCKQYKQTSDFGSNKSKKDGLATSCKVCKSKSDRDYRINNKDKVAAGKRKCYLSNRDHYDSKTKSWVNSNKDGRSKIIKRYYDSNQEAILEKQAIYRDNNREICRQRIKDWYLRNVDKSRAKDCKYRATKLKATPLWLTDNQLEDIVSVYRLARDCELISGQSYHVDHIVPLQGRDVCGLHVAWNLQVIPSDLNLKKSNRHNDW